VLVRDGQIRIQRPVFFATNRDRILPRSYPVLFAVAEAMRATAAIERVSIEGHTDDVGDDARNLALSQRRADSVMRFLVDHGIGAERLEAHGYGEARPIADNHRAAGRALNRRVEFHIVTPSIASAPSPEPSAVPISAPESSSAPSPSTNHR
jgi:outer membrane protein OmpA-like peptidoglycan-associated protein